MFQFMSESTLPPRKRRRPALSCVECRRRKIKCDRNMPCDNCKSVDCIYKDSYPASTDTRSAKPRSSTPSAALQSSRDSPVEKHAVKSGLSIPSSASLGSCGLLDGASLTRTVPIFSNDASSNATTLYSPSAGSSEELQVEPNTQVLLDRTNKLEHTPNTASVGNLDSQRTTFSNAQFLGPVTQVAVPGLQGSVSKTRLFGRSHWMCLFDHLEIEEFRNRLEIDPVGCIIVNGLRQEINSEEIKKLLFKCKNMARAVKAERPTPFLVNPNLKDYVPPRETSDKLVHFYLRTFESTSRILHVPTFESEYAEYWIDPQNASTVFLVKLLLVMAIGSTFYQELDYHSVRSSAQQWVYAAQSWMSAPCEKGRLNISGLQIYCLVLIARQTTGVGADLVWISVGALLRMAITMGFHRDPSLFPRMSVLHAEMRRRLWATVLEMTVSSSFDAANPPLLSPEDWDTEPPSNINDNEIDEMTKEPPVPKPIEVYTQTSLQIQLLKSLRTRLEISRLISDFRFQPSYDETLRLGTEILSFAREGGLLAQDSPEGTFKPTSLQRNLLDTPMRRILLALHFPFALKARTDPRFYFSRKVCLDAAITLLTYPSTSSPTSVNPLAAQHDDYTRLKLVGAGFVKELLLYASIVVQLELIVQLEEEPPLLRKDLDRKNREPLKGYLRYVIELFAQRISLGENNIKGHLFLSAANAQIEAMERNEDTGPPIAKAAKESAELCYGLLKARIKKPPASLIDEDDVKNSEMWEGKEGMMEFGSMTMDQEFSFEYLMPDTSVNFDIPESWLFEGWEEHHEW